MVIVLMIRLKNYSRHNVFNKKNVNTFDVLTFIQIRTDITEKTIPIKKQPSTFKTKLQRVNTL